MATGSGHVVDPASTAPSLMVSYVDTHCHLDLFSDPSATLDSAPQTIVVAVTELPSRYRLLSMRYRNDRRVRVALGLHPLRAATAGPFEEGLLVRELDRTEYVGEVGLDFSKAGRDSRDAQLRVFERLLAEPALRRKVVTVHSRGADRAVIDRLREAKVRAILHWYTGPPSLIDRALDAGMYFSINPAMLRTDKGRLAIAALPSDRVLTESDGPFARVSGRTSAPKDIPSVIGALAKQWQSTNGDARRVVHANLASLYASTVGTSQEDLVASEQSALNSPSATDGHPAVDSS